ncbi:hypothetical protein TrST_g10712 [Triparma strigata]|uniref:Ku domain-containing protein n=1 Tax=Triparma strigata TaxID=1606541 RepID=A0A9W7A9L5_9STRA|nr:hypothetical protein TrST_g10712 [Triparma strigata]
MSLEPATKDACVFIVDLSPSMLSRYASETGDTKGLMNVEEVLGEGQSRMSSAIHAVQVLISSQMLRSKVHECTVLLIGTSVTRNRLAASSGEGGGYNNVVELMEFGRPNEEVLRDLEKVKRRQGYFEKDFEAAFVAPEVEKEVEREAKKVKQEDVKMKGESGTTDKSDPIAMMMELKKKSKGRQTAVVSSRFIPPSTENIDPAKLAVPCDFLPGFILAADILYNYTKKKRSNRKIYLLTDGESRVKEMKPGELNVVLTGLKDMSTEITIIGLDFDTEGEFGANLGREKPSKLQKAMQAIQEEESEGDEEEESDSSSEASVNVKEENEKLLMSIAKITGGAVTAARNLIEMMKVAGTKKIPRSTKKKMEFTIAPNLVLNAEYSLLVSKANLPTLRTHAFIKDEEGTVFRDADSKPLMADLLKDTVYTDKQSVDIEVAPENRTKAYRYGGDYITTNAYDEESLKIESKIAMRVMGFVSSSSIPRGALIDSGYAITGGISPRAQTAISALAQAMEEDKVVAIARFVKMEDADPAIGVLMPMKIDLKQSNSEDQVPNKLVFIQMPFEEDYAKFTFRSFGSEETTELQKSAADDLIDQMMLGDDELCSTKLPNPAIRSLNRTLIKRVVEGAVEGGAGDEGGAKVDAIDESCFDEYALATPAHVLERCQVAAQKFSALFDLDKAEDEAKVGSRGASGGARRPKRYWSQIQEEDDL